MNKIINGVANDFEFDGIETFNRWQDPTINELKQQLDKYKNVIDKIKEYIKRKDLVNTNEITNGNIEYILELLEEVE